MKLPIDSIPSPGKFRLLTRLGAGGMGEVYLALARGPVGFQKLHVLKFLRDDLTDDVHVESLRMFEDEARIAARLNHPNVVQCHELAFDEARPYLAMEYLDGQPLSRIQQRVQQGATGWTLEIRLLVLAQVLDALEYAHELEDFDGRCLNVVHRDVSPDNVFVTYAGQVKLVDFGIAKTLHSRRTSTGVVKGKLRYMAPEQARGESVDARADLYALGVMLWEAVAQAPLYESNMSPHQLMRCVAEGSVPSLRDVCPAADPALISLVERALAPRREERWQSAAEMRAELGAIMARLARVEQRSVGAWVAHVFAVERSAILDVIRRASAGDFEAVSAVTMPTLPTLLPGFEMPAGAHDKPNRATRKIDTTAHDDRAGSSESQVQSIAGVAPAAPTEPAQRASETRWKVWASRIGLLAVVSVPAALAFNLSRGETASVSAPEARPALLNEPVALASEQSIAPATSMAQGNGAAAVAEPVPVPEAPRPTPAPTSKPSSERPKPPQVVVELRLMTLPAAAQLSLNGKPVANPYVARHRPAEALRFVASLRGYKSQTWAPVLDDSVVARGGMVYTIQLEQQARSPKPAANESAPTPHEPYQRFDLDPN